MTFTVRMPNLRGVASPLSTNYASGTGTAGTDATAMDVKTIVLAANSMRELGDRIRVRSYWKGDTGAAVTGTVKVNGVTVAHTTDGGGATLQVNEAWLHYVDNTHANIIENEAGALGSASAVNVSGFDFSAAQNIVISQNLIANNHIVVYFLAADVFHLGTTA